MRIADAYIQNCYSYSIAIFVSPTLVQQLLCLFEVLEPYLRSSRYVSRTCQRFLLEVAAPYFSGPPSLSQKSKNFERVGGQFLQGVGDGDFGWETSAS